MQSESKAKVLALRSIMSNPKLSKILEDGFNAPIGSTKRVQAKSIVSILKRMGSPEGSKGLQSFKEQAEKLKNANNPYIDIYKRAFDGQGGPSNPYDAVPKFLRRAPAPVEGFSISFKSKKLDGQGGPTSVVDPYAPSNPYSPNPDALSSFNPSANISNSTPSYVAPWAPSVPGQTPGLFGGAYSPSGAVIGAGDIFDEGLKYASTPVLGAAAFGEYGLDKLYSSLFPNVPKKLGDTAGMQILDKIFPVKSPSSPITSSAAGATTKPPIKGMVDWDNGYYTYYKGDGTTQTGQIGDKFYEANKNQGTKAPAKGMVEWDNGYYTYYYGDGTTETGQIGDNFYNEHKGEITNPGQNPSTPGAETVEDNPFAGTQFESMWDKLSPYVRQNLLSTISPGSFVSSMLNNREEMRKLYPNTPDSEIPFAAGLLGQQKALAAALRQEFHLDEIAAERNNMIKSGATLSVDLTDYIKGRDTFIKSVDDMISGVKRASKTGLSDPATQASNKTYINYLSVLKGRQNSRYIDLLNTSITHQDAVMADITNRYNTQVALYQEELASGREITKAKYDEMYADLSGMWALTQSGPEMARTAAKQQADIDMVRAQEMAQNIENAGGSTGSNATENPIFKDSKEIESRILDTSVSGANKFVPGFNIMDQIEFLVGQSGKSPAAVMDAINRGIQSTATDEAGVARAKGIIAAYETSGGSPYLSPDFAQQMRVVLERETSGALTPVISGNISEFSSATAWLTKRALNDLTDKEKQNFLNSFKTISQEHKEALWEYYKSTLTKESSFNKDKTTRQAVFKTDPAGLAKQISYWVSKN